MAKQKASDEEAGYTEVEPEVEPEVETTEAPAEEVVPTAFDAEAEQPEAPEQENFATLEEAMARQNELATEGSEDAGTAPESEFEPADEA